MAKTYTGGIVRLPIGYFDKRKGPSLLLKNDIKWNPTYTSGITPIAIDIDLRGGVTTIDLVRSMMVDNTFYNWGVTVVFSDTNWRIFCPPFNYVVLPVLSNSLQFTIFNADTFEVGAMNTQSTLIFSTNERLLPATQFGPLHVI